MAALVVKAGADVNTKSVSDTHHTVTRVLTIPFICSLPESPHVEPPPQKKKKNPYLISFLKYHIYNMILE